MNKMVRSFKYRLLPTKRQHHALGAILVAQRALYNAALEERIDCYRKTGKTLSLIDQCKALTKWRQSDEEARSLPANLQRATLKRVDLAYSSFFRRVRRKKVAPGFPRFKGPDRFKSFGFIEFSGITFDGRKLRWKGLPGALRVHIHRALPDAAIKSCVLTRDAKGWAVLFHVHITALDLVPIGKAVGLDLGLNAFAYQSDGLTIPNPRIARSSEKKMRQRRRALARCTPGSSRRVKVRRRLSRLHSRIVNTRMTWLHQQSCHLVRSYDLIAAEDLNVSGMMKNHHLARSIADASWSKFLAMVAYKAEGAGKQFIVINPRNTSQKCSGCGELVPKSRDVRTHSCPSCGLILDRDWNAAKNILQAVVGLGQPNVTQWSERAAGNLVGEMQ